MRRKLKSEIEKMKMEIAREIGNWKLETGKSISTFNFPISIFIFLLLAACTAKETAHQHDTYTCPMHPTVISDRHGTCPVCGMDLVRKMRPGEEVKITEDLSKRMKSPNEAVVASIKTIKGEFKSVPVSVEADGVVTYDTRNIYLIPARVGGRVEKIYLKYEFQSVNKGQKIVEIYSPELITAQRELLYLVEHDAANEQLINSAKSKLQLLGLTDSQINDLINRKEVSNSFTIYSPYSGYLIADNGAPPSPSTMTPSSASQREGMDGMTPSSSAGSQSKTTNASGTTGSLLREGDYISAGRALFKVINTNALRIELDLAGDQAGLVHSGDIVELDFEGEKEKANVDFVQPFFTEGQNFLKIRVYTKRKLHIGQLVKATISIKPRESLWVPREAVLDLGNDKVVFIRDKEVFKPKRITAGIYSDGLVEVKSGLASSDEIAADAHFLVDSESFVKIRD